mmetsp:Transcript_39278/g.90761  ORF Transcript_39278/g.90761 Transcript_39278/m.90761 type:complete len:156 (+) Transcript_39278:476-943(+)
MCGLEASQKEQSWARTRTRSPEKLNTAGTAARTMRRVALGKTGLGVAPVGQLDMDEVVETQGEIDLVTEIGSEEVVTVIARETAEAGTAMEEDEGAVAVVVVVVIGDEMIALGLEIEGMREMIGEVLPGGKTARDATIAIADDWAHAPRSHGCNI